MHGDRPRARQALTLVEQRVGRELVELVVEPATPGAFASRRDFSLSGRLQRRPGRAPPGRRGHGRQPGRPRARSPCPSGRGGRRRQSRSRPGRRRSPRRWEPPRRRRPAHLRAAQPSQDPTRARASSRAGARAAPPFARAAVLRPCLSLPRRRARCGSRAASRSSSSTGRSRAEQCGAGASRRDSREATTAGMPTRRRGQGWCDGLLARPTPEKPPTRAELTRGSTGPWP